MSDEERDEQRQLDEVYGPVPKLNRELRREKVFEAWHLPRKQYVRRRQWCASLNRLLEHLKKSVGGLGTDVRYLGLPGEELLDIRAFHEVCQMHGAKLRFLGFNTKANKSLEVRLSFAEVTDLPNVDRVHSRVEAEKFECISTHRTEGGRRFREQGPYDVINLDLCDSVAGDQPKNVNGTLQALRTVVEHQLFHRTAPWLLFLTTRVGEEYVDRDVFTTLVERVLQNMLDSDDFAADVTGEFRSELSAARLLELLDGHPVPHRMSADLFSLGLCKWLLALRGEREWLVDLESAYTYTVKEHRPDLISLAFRFTHRPKPLVDPLGLTVDQKEAATRSLHEVDLARRMVKPLARAVDLDIHLARNPEVADEMVEESAALLLQAGHHQEEYVSWAREQTAMRGK